MHAFLNGDIQLVLFNYKGIYISLAQKVVVNTKPFPLPDRATFPLSFAGIPTAVRAGQKNKKVAHKDKLSTLCFRSLFSLEFYF